MLRGAGLRQQVGLRQVAEPLAFSMDIPVVATEVAKGVWEILVRVNITPSTGLDIATNKTFTQSGTYTTRAAKEAEVAVLLWKSPGIAGLYIVETYDNVVGPQFWDGQWNVVPDQASLTHKDGYVMLGRPGWKGVAADRASSTMILEDGWYRITAQHLTSGYMVARRFEIVSQWYDSNSLSPQVLKEEGTPQSASFRQARLGRHHAGLRQPFPRQPSYAPFGSMTPYL